MLAKNPLELYSDSGWLKHLIHSSHLLNTSNNYWDIDDFRRRLGTGRYLGSGAESTALSGDMFPAQVGTFSQKQTDVSPVLTHHRQSVSWMPKLRAGNLVESAWTWADLFSELDVHGQLHLKLLQVPWGTGRSSGARLKWIIVSRIILLPARAWSFVLVTLWRIMVLIYICTSLYRKLTWSHIFWFFPSFWE